MEQTTIEWLSKKLESYGNPQYCELKWEELDLLIKKAKAMEKQQIVNAFCVNTSVSKKLIGYKSKAEQYYNETYKK